MLQYCAIRRQFQDRDAPQSEDQKPVESQVLNYSLVQYRIFPVMVQALACHYCKFFLHVYYYDRLK